MVWGSRTCTRLIHAYSSLHKRLHAPTFFLTGRWGGVYAHTIAPWSALAGHAPPFELDGPGSMLEAKKYPLTLGMAGERS